MEFREVRELVRIRHELRKFAFGGDRDEATALLTRLSALAARDPVEHAAALPELQRWRLRLGLQEAEASAGYAAGYSAG